MEHALLDARQALEQKQSRQVLTTWQQQLEESEKEEPKVEEVKAPPVTAPVIDPMVEQRERERAAAAALEETRIREANERDAALKDE